LREVIRARSEADVRLNGGTESPRDEYANQISGGALERDREYRADSDEAARGGEFVV